MLEINIKDAIKMVKNEAMTSVILYSHMPNISLEDKLYLMYFMGMMSGKGEEYSLKFEDEKIEFELNESDRLNIQISEKEVIGDGALCPTCGCDGWIRYKFQKGIFYKCWECGESITEEEYRKLSVDKFRGKNGENGN